MEVRIRGDENSNMVKRIHLTTSLLTAAATHVGGTAMAVR